MIILFQKIEAAKIQEIIELFAGVLKCGIVKLI
jgi:hypothetical protein